MNNRFTIVCTTSFLLTETNERNTIIAYLFYFQQESLPYVLHSEPKKEKRCTKYLHRFSYAYYLIWDTFISLHNSRLLILLPLCELRNPRELLHRLFRVPDDLTKTVWHRRFGPDPHDA